MTVTQERSEGSDMANNLYLGPDAQGRFLLTRLKAFEGRGAIQGGSTPVIEGVHFSVDPQAEVAGRFDSRPGRIISFSIKPRRATEPRWQALHLALGPLDLSGAGVVGVVVRSRAKQAVTTRICLRSGRSDSFVDHFLGKTLVSHAQDSTHLDAIDLTTATDLPRRADWRDLILFLRTSAVELEVLDLRFFVV